jgi:hypothetical protein
LLSKVVLVPPATESSQASNQATVERMTVARSGQHHTTAFLAAPLDLTRHTLLLIGKLGIVSGSS